MSLVKQEEYREFRYTDKDFQCIRRLIRGRAGISLSEAKRDMVYSRLARRLRARGLRRFSEYLELLRLGDEPEWEAFINALTTNLTSFFRVSGVVLRLFQRRGGLFNRHYAGRDFCIADTPGFDPGR
jgi:hypothetical protein